MSELTDRRLSAREVGRLFRVAEATVGRWAKEGKLSFTTNAFGHRRYDPGEIAKLLDQCGSAR